MSNSRAKGSIHQPMYEIKYDLRHINLLHVPAPGCHPQDSFRSKEYKPRPRWNVQNIKILKDIKLKILKLQRVALQLCDRRSRYKFIAIYLLYAVCI